MLFDGSDKTYDKDIANRICMRIADGEYVRHACRAEGVEASTIYSWLSYEPDFAKNWEIALRIKADLLVEKAIKTLEHPADDDVVYAGKDMNMCNGARVNRAKHLADKYIWWAAKCDRTLSDKDPELQDLKKQVAELEKMVAQK